jgi:VanZ family protein
MSNESGSRAWHALFLLYLLVMALLFLIPVPHRLNAAATRFDGLAHFLIFLGFTLLHQFDRRPAAIRTLLVAVLLAGGVELVQGALPYRSAQWADFIAGVAGAGAGVLLSFALPRKEPA